MAMTSGGMGGGPTAEINMTPMIDVLLVLLIIFMVIQPTLQKGIEVQVPPVEERTSAESPPDQIILQVDPGPSYSINGIAIAPQNLEQRVAGIFQDRPRKVLFVKGAENIRYGDVINAIDLAKAGGIEVVGLVPREP
jgi:biopolymer transport protein ExbD